MKVLLTKNFTTPPQRYTRERNFYDAAASYLPRCCHATSFTAFRAFKCLCMREF